MTSVLASIPLFIIFAFFPKRSLDEKGCVFNSDNEIVFKDAIKTNAIDTTAAVDSFIGAMCVALGGGKTIEEAVRYAAKVSSITVSRRGASSSIPYANEI